MLGISILASVFLLRDTVVGEYVVPAAWVEPLYPIGLRISLPHESGIIGVHFHIKLNEVFDGFEGGSITWGVTNLHNEKWIYDDRKTRLRRGDIIYYWIYVTWMDIGYSLLDQHHQVTEFYNINGSKVTTWPCVPTDSKVFVVKTGENRAVCSGQLLLDDQFDQLNEELWTKIERFTGTPDYAFVVYRDDRRNVHVTNGKLNIVPTLMEPDFGVNFTRRGSVDLVRCTAERGSQDCRRTARGAYILPPVISGSMYTKNSVAFTYGVVEIRAKLPRGDWIYPVIVLEPLETNSSSSTRQLRVASAFGNPVLRECSDNDSGSRTLCGGAFKFDTSTVTSAPMPSKYSVTPWSDDYHVYELEWRRDKILSRVDGLVYGSTKTEEPFDRPFYVKLGLAVGGHNEFPDSCRSNGYAKPWRNVGAKALFDFYNARHLWIQSWYDDAINLKVDYIRIWAL